MRRLLIPAALAVVAVIAAVAVHVQISDIYYADDVLIGEMPAESGVWYDVTGGPAYIQFLGRSLVFYVLLNTTTCSLYVLDNPVIAEHYYLNASGVYKYVEIQQVNATLYRIVIKAPAYGLWMAPVYCHPNAADTAVKVKIP
ncbi:MAG: hypothetical protein C0167_02110 [Nitrososphaera sp.]|nr:MAG: hypothetical protein C0167_02110 [Nitrososphaera sp.]